MTEFTTNLHFSLVDFNVATWHDEVNDNFRSLDAILNAFTGLTGILGPWQNSTVYTVGQRVIDINLDSLWEVAINHTSDAAGTFADYRTAHPTHWTLVTAGIPNPYNVPGNFSVAGTSILTGAVRLAATAPSYINSKLTVRGNGNEIEWGHASGGFSSVLGNDVGGTDFIGFHVGAGTTANTYQTVGQRGTIIKGDLSGGLKVQNVANANADNQVPVDLFAVSNAGAVTGFKNIKGTVTNDDAIATNIGEVIATDVLAGAAVALVTGTGKTVAQITLSAGDWDLYGSIIFITAATTSITNLRESLSGVDNTIDTTSNRFASTYMAAIVPGVVNWGMAGLTHRVSINANTTFYLVALGTFTVAALTAYGKIWARRAR